MSFKEGDLRKKNKDVFVAFFLLPSYLSFLVFFICSCRFELPSEVISIMQCNFTLTHFLCTIIYKYMTFLHVIHPTIQLYTYCIIQFFLKASKKRKQKLYAFILSNYIVMLTSALFSCELKLLPGDIFFFQPEELHLIFHVLPAC